MIRDDRDTWALRVDTRRASSSGDLLMCPSVRATACDGWLMRACNLRLSPRVGLPSPSSPDPLKLSICTWLSDRLAHCFTKLQRNKGTSSSSSAVTLTWKHTQAILHFYHTSQHLPTFFSFLLTHKTKT